MTEKHSKTAKRRIGPVLAVRKAVTQCSVVLFCRLTIFEKTSDFLTLCRREKPWKRRILDINFSKNWGPKSSLQEWKKLQQLQRTLRRGVSKEFLVDIRLSLKEKNFLKLPNFWKLTGNSNFGHEVKLLILMSKK